MTRNKIEEGGGTKKKNVHIYIYGFKWSKTM